MDEAKDVTNKETIDALYKSGQRPDKFRCLELSIAALEKVKGIKESDPVELAERFFKFVSGESPTKK